MISLDIELLTFAIQIVATIVLFIVVKIFFAKPMKKYLDARRGYIEDEFKKAQLANDEVLAAQNEVLAERKKIENEAKSIIKAATLKAQEKYDAIVETAKSDATVQLENARANIEKERQEMLYDAKKDIEKTAHSVASKLVKKEIDANRHDDLFDDFVSLIGGDVRG